MFILSQRHSTFIDPQGCYCLTMRTFILAVALLLIPVHPAAAAADKWTSIQSKNISIVGDASDAQLRHVAEEFEQLRATIESLLSHKNQDPTVNTTVIV